MSLSNSPSVSPDFFRARRRAFQERLPEDGVAVFFSAPERIRSNDVHYRYRQDSDFYFLTGFEEEDGVLVLTREAETLYLPERDKTREVWEGVRIGYDEAVERLGVAEAKKRPEFAADLRGDLLKNKGSLYYHFGESPERDARILGAARSMLRRARKGDYGPANVVSPGVILHEMRLRKSEAELQILRESAAITAAAHGRLLAETRPGMFEYELEALIQYEFRRCNAVEGYPSIVASGPNACILHHIRNDRRIEPGDLILVDAGAEKNFFSADVTRTFPASERFTPEQREVYQAALAAQQAAIEATVPGASMHSVHQTAARVLSQALQDMEIIDPSLSMDHILEKEIYKPFYIHKTGHWLGMDVHDVGAYYTAGAPRPFEPGMVCTVEPGLYFSPDARRNAEAAAKQEEQELPEGVRWERAERFHGIGVRIEDDVVVTEGAPENLTGVIPKSAEAIESKRAEALDLAGRAD